ncbi:hypothetical protein UY3_04239 [Chelonia mydas]|uniref:Uncharacterized protein n=1 Tax=Chelonia mydas TaxID=8469 RepID=M7BMS7_CHEMY|nr:hypothetical protein UY3_04239 [Chelonia mydas]
MAKKSQATRETDGIFQGLNCCHVAPGTVPPLLEQKRRSFCQTGLSVRVKPDYKDVIKEFLLTEVMALIHFVLNITVLC